MPATSVDSNMDDVGPYNRLSASQVNTYNSCPRLWYYEKVLHFKMPQIPVLFVGRAVEDAFCRMLRESPGFITQKASSDTLSNTPLGEDGKPDRDEEKIWPSQRLLPLPEKLMISKLEELRIWATSRIDVHLPISLEQMRLEWESDERKSGDWKQVDPNYCRQMCINGLEMHLLEVQHCLKENGGPQLEQWRGGFRENWPSPDGLGFTISGSHPLAGQGEVSLIEAWEITRPWFVEPDAVKFSMNAIHPDFWFQGEYDLVYRWNGIIKIVDLKASIGKGDRSGNYVEQLKMYAMLWWVTHDKKQSVDELEIWYLGADKIKPISVPNEEELLVLEKELSSLWSKLKEAPPSIEVCSPAPSPMRGFLEGGVPTTAPDISRCMTCDWKEICPSGSGTDNFPQQKSFNLPGTITPLEVSSIEELNPRLDIVCDVFSIFDMNSEKRPSVTINQGHNMAKIDILVDKHQDGQQPWPNDLSKGDRVLIENAIMTVNWKGEIIAKIDPWGMISKTDKGVNDSSSLMEFRARWNLFGKLIYKFDKKGIGRNGKEWHRRGIMLMDSTGSIKVTGWAKDWGSQYEMAEVGDLILISNAGIDAWATQVRADISRNSKLKVISPTG